jgi:hypothetical protein
MSATPSTPFNRGMSRFRTRSGGAGRVVAGAGVDVAGAVELGE